MKNDFIRICYKKFEISRWYTIRKPATISMPPTTRRYHLDGNLKSSSFAKGKTFAYLAYSVRRSLWRSRLIFGVILRTPRNIKNDPSNIDKLLSTILDILLSYGRDLHYNNIWLYSVVVMMSCFLLKSNEELT